MVDVEILKVVIKEICTLFVSFFDLDVQDLRSNYLIGRVSIGVPPLGDEVIEDVGIIDFI